MILLLVSYSFLPLLADSVDFSDGLLNKVLPYKVRPRREFRLYEAESKQVEGLEDEDKMGG